MWKMDGETVDVADENEHLGLVVTGFHEEQRNIEENISRGRRSLYSLLGPAFSFPLSSLSLSLTTLPHTSHHTFLRYYNLHLITLLNKQSGEIERGHFE